MKHPPDHPARLARRWVREQAHFCRPDSRGPACHRACSSLRRASADIRHSKVLFGVSDVALRADWAYYSAAFHGTVRRAKRPVLDDVKMDPKIAAAIAAIG
jgi:hypothetical protein